MPGCLSFGAPPAWQEARTQGLAGDEVLRTPEGMAAEVQLDRVGKAWRKDDGARSSREFGVPKAVGVWKGARAILFIERLLRCFFKEVTTCTLCSYW
jgi:hypothetical protein